jgi:hypothetical protein
MICLIDNDRVLRMARRLDGRLSFEHGAALARIEPTWPTLWTLREEAIHAAPAGMASPRCCRAVKKGGAPPGSRRQRRV